MPFQKPQTNPNFPELEDKVNALWEEHDVFAQSVAQRKDKPMWRFYDGPPFISGTPHYGHIKDFVMKDAVPRYWAMKGYQVPRVWGWDAHGLPIENKVEKKLGLRSKLEVEQLGIERYIEECYAYTRSTSAEWPWYIKKMGRWVDYDHAYRTMDQDYMESVWWAFKSLHEKGLIYRGWRASLYSTDSATPVSNFEIAMDNTYEDVVDDAVTVKFKLGLDSRFAEVFGALSEQLAGAPVYALSWTTTPWTLAANVALAVNNETEYALVRTTPSGAALEKVWQVTDLPFDLGKAQPVKVERYLLSAAGEAVTAEAVASKSRYRLTDLQELDVFVSKYGKNFFLEVEAEQFPLSQQEYQELSKLTNLVPLKFIRVYYPLQIGKTQLTVKVDNFSDNLAGLQLATIEFASDKQYRTFLAEQPTWLGAEVAAQSLQTTLAAQQATLASADAAWQLLQSAPVVSSDQSAAFEYYLVALKLAEQLFSADYEVLASWNGSQLVGLRYEQLLPYLSGGANDFQIYASETVTDTDGTGVLHVAPGYGEEDFEIGQKYGLSVLQVIDAEGKLLPEITDFAGVYLRAAAGPIIRKLKLAGQLHRAEKYTHRLPFYRYENPLIYRAQESWFLNVQKLKPELLAANESINWVPDHLKEGRFKKGIETAPDWSLSRNRFWSTPMPVWVLEDVQNPGKAKPNYSDSEVMIVGSRDEVAQLAAEPVTKLVVTEVASDTSELLAPEVLSNLQSALQAKMAAAGVKKSGRLPETELQEVFSAAKAALPEMLAVKVRAAQGGELRLDVSPEVAALIKHIYEGGDLALALAGDLGLGNSRTHYLLPRTSGVVLLDLHRPLIDSVKLKHAQTGETYVRIPEVLDVWMDSGSMPYAQLHYPFQQADDFKSSFPADYIVEYIAQTRAWFYVLHVLSVGLFGEKAFRNAVTSGVIFGTDGRKMSKSYGNYPDPKLTLEKYGAEAMRWYFLTSNLIVGDDISFDEKSLHAQTRQYLLPFWNIYSFFATYAQLHNWQPEAGFLSNQHHSEIRTIFSVPDGAANDTYQFKVPLSEREHKLDAWLVAKLQALIHDVRAALDEYQIPTATRKLQDFITELSKWYVRLSRQRFQAGDQQAFETLYYVLVELSKLTAPFTPFMAEEMYQRLVTDVLPDEKLSVHLNDYPEADIDYWEDHAKLLAQMDEVAAIVDLGQTLRTQKGLKVRQPLAQMVVNLNSDPARDYNLEQWMEEIIRGELNVLDVKERNDLRASDPAAAGLVPAEKWVLAENTTRLLTIALDVEISAELALQGLERELTRAIQALRKKLGLQLGEKVTMELASDDANLQQLVEARGNEIAVQVSATALTLVPLGKAASTDNSVQINAINCYLTMTK